MARTLDPKGRIAKAKAKMPVACSVRKSKYCDEIISMRLQGYPYRKIEDWLRGKGGEFHIPAATICRNLIVGLGNEQDYVPVYEQEAESAGGDITVDPGRTLAGQAMIQRQRIDYMVRQEAEKRRTQPGFSNYRIRQEMETYLSLVQSAAQFELDKRADDIDPTKGNSVITPAAEEALAQMIIDGLIKVPGSRKVSVEVTETK